MAKKSIVVKDDINFLEYPNWILSRSRDAPKILVLERPNGTYKISVSEDMDRLPDRTDKILLYTLLHQLFKDDFKKREIKLTRYKLAKLVYNKIPWLQQLPKNINIYTPT